MAVNQFRPDSTALQRVANAMVVAAYQEIIQSFDIEGMLDSLCSDNKLAAAFKKQVAALENYKEYRLTPEKLVKNLVAYVDEDQAICCFNPEVVNDVLPESTEAFSEAINQETKKEAAKEATQQSLSVKPDQRTSWMP